MNTYDVLIVSERILFRKTFRKLLDVLEVDINRLEHDGTHEQLQPGEIPAAANGVVLIDCAALVMDDVIDCMLHLLCLQAESAIVVVMDEQEDAIIDTVMSLGAVGAIVKASPPQVIMDSLTQILSGVRCRPAPVINIPRTDVPEHIRKQLSARRQRMLRAIMGGQSITATAQQLGLTPDKLVTEMRQVIAVIRGREF